MKRNSKLLNSKYSNTCSLVQNHLAQDLLEQLGGLWELEHYLTQSRKEIDRKYDFRSSRLTDVLGRLLYENRLGEEDLRGLREEKMKSIRSFAQFLREGAA